MSPTPDDRRFEELMAREFPDGLVPTRQSRPQAASPEPAAPEEPEGPAAATDFRSWTPPEEPEEPFSPPPAPPARRWTPTGIVGTVLVLVPLVMVLFAAFGVWVPTWASILAGGALVTGVGLLLQRLRRRPPPDGDGAVI